jgi:hypothetical protein
MFNYNMVLCIIVAVVGFFLIDTSYKKRNGFLRPCGVILLSGASFIAGAVSTLHYLFP